MFIDARVTVIGAPAERNVDVNDNAAPLERSNSYLVSFYKHFVPPERSLWRLPLLVNHQYVAQILVVLLVAGGLKYFYSTAGVNQLRWILAPTTWLVEIVSGDRFQFESHAGYINSNHTFLIAASCAGVNFLITAFLMLALGQLWRRRTQTLSLIFIPVTALVAYGVTLVTNMVRIATALQLRAMRVESDWLTPGQLHRFEGIFIYFGFLLLLYVVSERLSNKRSSTSERIPAQGGFLPTLRSFIFPLLVYYATTLGIPLINGAFRHRDFWEHSLFVLLIPLVFILPFAGLTFMRELVRTSFYERIVSPCHTSRQRS